MVLTRFDGHPVITVPGPDYFSKLHNRLARLGRLPLWVVCNQRTRDYPGAFVARMHVTLPEPKPTRFVIVHEDLAELRKLLPPGLDRIVRSPQDAAVIIETWL